jgi:CubicO group peptidase (beta-lactamase class C family)
MKRIGDVRPAAWCVALLVALLPFVGCSEATVEPLEATPRDEVQERADNFRSMSERLPVRIVPRSSNPRELLKATETLEIEYEYQGTNYAIDDFINRTDTTGLLILHAGKIHYEGYFRGADETSRFLSMSVAKSFTATLLGIARSQGLIGSFDDPVTKYLPQLAATGYDGVPIKDLLQMSSGIDFVEEYENEESDIARLGAAGFGGEERVNEIAVSFGRKRESGEEFYYASVDTQILAMVLERVTGKRLSQSMSEWLWQPLGAEHDAYWILDQEGDSGIECAFGGLNVSLRDYGRFGQLMAYDGMWDGDRILPAGWVAEATIPDAPHVQPGELADGYKMGYQYQWWTFPDDDHSFTGEGIYGQLLMVNPELDLVMVKTSAWPSAWVSDKERESWALWDAVNVWARAAKR